MKRFGYLIGIVVLVALVIGFLFWSRLPDMLANRLSAKLQVPVEIDSIGLKLAGVDVKNIQIGNPPGSILAKAFTCQEIDVDTPWTRYLHDNVVVDTIELNQVYLGLEFDSAKGASGNWTTIMSNLNSGTEKPKPKKKADSNSTPSGRTLLIHKLILTDIDVDVVYRKEGGKVQKLPRIPRIELTEISSEGGFPIDQLMNSILGEMLKQVFIKENLKNMLQNLLENQNPLKEYINPFKGLFNVGPTLVED